MIKRLDNQGRIVIPANWRKKYGVKRVKIIVRDDMLIIKPFVSKKLSDLFDTLEMDIKAPLTDWKKLKKELLTGEQT